MLQTSQEQNWTIKDNLVDKDLLPLSVQETDGT